MGRRSGHRIKHLMAVNRHRIPQGQLAAPAGFNRAVHPHIATLDPQLRLTAGAHQALKFEELVEFQGPATYGSDSVAPCLHLRRPAFDSSGRC